MPAGLRLVAGWLSVSLLASMSPGLEEALQVMDRKVDAPQELGEGLALLHGRAQGGTWFQTIGSDEPFGAPDDRNFRALLRDRCADDALGALIARGAVVHETRSFGPHQVHVFTLTMSSAICDQVGLERDDRE